MKFISLSGHRFLISSNKKLNISPAHALHILIRLVKQFVCEIIDPYLAN